MAVKPHKQNVNSTWHKYCMRTKEELKTTINLEINHDVDVTNNTIIIGTGSRDYYRQGNDSMPRQFEIKPSTCRQQLFRRWFVFLQEFPSYVHSEK